MNVKEMHVMFRQYAQQMGMQNVRAILPEQIDLLLNTSTMDTINQVITEHINTTSDRVITDNSKLGQINALVTLYKTFDVVATPSLQDVSSITNPFVKGPETITYKISSPIANFKFHNGKPSFDYLYLRNFDLNYSDSKGIMDKPKIITNYFPVRLIDDAYLADTLNDFVLAPRLRTPIAIISDGQIDIYIDTYVDGSLPEGLVPYNLRVSYIAKPAKIAYKSDLTGNINDDVNCDLPDYMHVEIVKHAVDLYRVAIAGSVMGAQAQEQQARQEAMRNNYRNEGYPQQQVTQ